MKIVLFLVGAVLFITAVSGAYYLGQKQSATAPAAPERPVSTQPTPTAPATSSPTVSPAPTDPNIKTFSSTDLGISFNYLEMQDGEKFAAKQSGNKVYIYQTKFPVEQGQYVEVFPKDKTDDLKTAIEKKFLINYSKADCFVEIGKNPVAKQIVPTSFVFGTIGFPKPSDGNMESFAVATEKCPRPYTTFGGIAYFLTDTTHPDKFVFFSIGQYAINAGPSLPWQSTIKFL